MPGQAGPCRVKYMPVTGGQLSALLYRRALRPAPLRARRPFSRIYAALSYALTGKGPMPHFSAARHALQPAPLRARRPSGFMPHSRMHLPGKAPCRMFSCTARLAACTAAGAPSVRPGSCRTLVCIRRADTLYQKNSAKPTAFFRRGAKRRALKIYLTHSARRGTLKAAIFYIFWEDLS